MNKALTCHWNLWSRNYMPKPENILCICLVDCIPQEKVEYNQQSLACYSKLLFFPKKLYWRRTSVIFQIILNKPNCSWDQHPSSNDLVYCVFFVAAAFSDGWQAGKVEAAVASAGFQLLLCRSLFSWWAVQASWGCSPASSTSPSPPTSLPAATSKSLPLPAQLSPNDVAQVSAFNSYFSFRLLPLMLNKVTQLSILETAWSRP